MQHLDTSRGKNLIFKVLAFLICSIGIGLQAQPIFFEGFNSDTIPGSFTIVDNDNNTPQPNYSFFTEAWITFFQTDGDTVAASTSWFSSPGQTADVWLITPSINIPSAGFIFKWEAEASQAAPFNDGYEVRISTTDTELASFTDVIFSTPGEQADVPATRFESLDAYAGQTIYIAIRNNSTVKNILFIDNLSVEAAPSADAAIVATAPMNLQYILQPVKHASPFNLEALVVNQGSDTLTDVRVNAFVFNVDLDLVNPVHVDTMGGAIDTLVAGDSIIFSNSTDFVPQDTGLYGTIFVVSSAQVDNITANDTAIEVFNITDSIYARDIPSSAVARAGVNNTPSSSKFVGNAFDLTQSDLLTSVDVTLFPDADNLGDNIFAFVYTTSELVPGIFVPQAPLGVTTTVPITAADTGNIVTLSLPLAGGSLALDSGRYVVAINEPNQLVNILIGEERFAPLGSWLTSDAADPQLWNTTEFAYDDPNTPEDDGNVVFFLRANFNQCAALTAVLDSTADDGSNNGTAMVMPEGGTPPYSYSWSSGQITNVAVGLASGAYSVTVSDQAGCIKTFDLSVPLLTSVNPLSIGINSIDLYPNPSTGIFRLDLELEKADQVNVALYDLLGKRINQQSYRQVSSKSIDFNLSGYPTGMYQVQISTSRGQISKRIVIE